LKIPRPSSPGPSRNRLDGSGVATVSALVVVELISSVPVKKGTKYDPPALKLPKPDKSNVPFVVGNGTSKSRDNDAPSGGLAPVPQLGKKLEFAAVPNAKQPYSPYKIEAKPLTIVHELVPLVTVNGVKGSVAPVPTNVGTVKENENGFTRPTGGFVRLMGVMLNVYVSSA